MGESKRCQFIYTLTYAVNTLTYAVKSINGEGVTRVTCTAVGAMIIDADVLTEVGVLVTFMDF